MKVRIVCYEDVDAWILGKFARRLRDNLELLGTKADIAKVPDRTADINHHIIYYDYDGEATTTETVMVTHIDMAAKVKMLKHQLKKAAMGICMSYETVEKLTSQGISRSKLCYVNPAHDGVMKPRKVIVGITSKVQATGCKREYLLAHLADRIPPDGFRFKIMGSGWESIVQKLKLSGIEVDYYDCFEYDKYLELIAGLDYYLYLGQDEGSMGFLDALAAGVETIVTPQGFHLDAPGGITFAFNQIEELEKIFLDIWSKKRSLVRSVSSWTWSEYARKHMLIWQYLLSLKGRLSLPDALNSELQELGVITSKPSTEPIKQRVYGIIRNMMRR